MRSDPRALNYLLKQYVDIVFTDIFMANGESLELLRELYRLKFCPRVVAMSGGEHASIHDLLHVAACELDRPGVFRAPRDDKRVKAIGLRIFWRGV